MGLLLRSFGLWGVEVLEDSQHLAPAWLAPNLMFPRLWLPLGSENGNTVVVFL